VDTSEKSILIVDADKNTNKALAIYLLFRGYKVFSSTNGTKALEIIKKEEIHLVTLDILLPKLDGYEVCRQIRENYHIPIIIITALNNLSSRVMGFELGADDFITKPFFLKDVEIRINSNLRRSNFRKDKRVSKRQEIFYFGCLTINLTKQQVIKNNKLLSLTKIEFSLLQLLIQNSGHKLSRALILDNVWGYTPQRDIDTRVVDVHIHRLRSKLEENPKNPDFILTARGTGYMFQTLKQ
jgi:OmpR family response regulator RpaB